MKDFHLDRYTLSGLGAILIWSTSIALVRSISEQVGPLTGAAGVYLVGGALSLGYQVFFGRESAGRVRRLPPKYLLGCGALFVLYMLALYLAVGLAEDRRQVLGIGLLNYLWPALTILFSLPLLKKKAGLMLAPGTFLGLLGVFFVLTPEHPFSLTSLSDNVATNPAAHALALVAAVSWALYSNLTRRWAGPASGGGITFFLLATGIILLSIRFLSPQGDSWNLRAGLEVLFLGVFTAAAYALWDMAMRKGDLVLVAACSYFTPLLSTLLSCFYLQVTAGVALWLGGFLIVAGSLMSWAAVSDRGSPISGPQ